MIKQPESSISDPGKEDLPPAKPGETVAVERNEAVKKGTTPSFAGLLAEPMSPDEPGWLAHYRVLKLLGRGGMGMVFQAEDTHLQRIVALKVILPEYATNAVARDRFLREARAGAGIKNDHVVVIYQVGQDRDIPFLAMEFLQGQSLEDRMLSGEIFSMAEILRIGREIATGLAAAHAHGLIHRDVKPANIWLETGLGVSGGVVSGGVGKESAGHHSPLTTHHSPSRVKILDFGLARPTGTRSSLTQTGNVVGTPEFMSPEQARGDELDPRSDLFSLGTILYALCTGRKPFQGDSVMAILTALAVDDPAPLRDLNSEVPPALADLVERLLQKDRSRRPASAEEVRKILEAIEKGTAATAGLPQDRPGSPTIPIRLKSGPRGRRWEYAATGMLVGLLLLGLFFFTGWFNPREHDSSPAPGPIPPKGPPIRIGVLHSRNGTMALSERPVIDAVLLAVEEINEAGGLLGRPVEFVLADGQSDETVFAKQAEKLIQQDQVCTIFGCWTSASRKAVVPVVERHNHLLYYPVQYEGVELSPNVIYGGPVPNQQILPALRWLVGFEGKKRWFLVGSDYVFPATANAVIRDEAKARSCDIVGEEYLLLGSTEVADVVRKIACAKPDLIVNTVNGDTNIALFRALRRAGITPKTTPTLSFSISEEELSALGSQVSRGDYVAANYFQSLDTPENRGFVSRFARRYGAERVISSPMETAYTGVHLWARAVKSAGRDEAPAIREAFKGEKYDAPQGPVCIDPATLHTTQVARIGQVDDTGRLMEVYLSPQPIAAQPYPDTRSRADWLCLLEQLHKRWGGRWSNLGQ